MSLGSRCTVDRVLYKASIHPLETNSHTRSMKGGAVVQQPDQEFAAVSCVTEPEHQIGKSNVIRGAAFSRRWRAQERWQNTVGVPVWHMAKFASH